MASNEANELWLHLGEPVIVFLLSLKGHRLSGD